MAKARTKGPPEETKAATPETGTTTWPSQQDGMFGDSPSRVNRLGEANQAREKRTRKRRRLTRRWSMPMNQRTDLDSHERAT